jgi:hypothetical protein
MAFRYSYTATMTQVTRDSDDNITGSSEVSFACDYQPNVNNTSINVAGSNVPIAYQLFVPKSVTYEFPIGTDVICNGSKGSIALSVLDKFGTEIYVKG